MNDYELENLSKSIELCFKENYCAMSFSDLLEKFDPITYDTLLYAVRMMEADGKLIADGSLIRLVIK